MAGVETQHEEYEEYAPLWRIMRDCDEGQHAIHEAGSMYLPKLGGQDNDDYAAYKKRAVWHNATRRTIEAMVGMLFRKPAEVTAPENDTVTEYLDNIDLNWTDVDAFAKRAAREIVTVGKVAVLVDFNGDGGAIVTQSAAIAENRRPYATFYEAESLVNWRTETINGTPKLSLAVLAENIEHHDGFETKYERVYRVLTLEEGRYIVRIWRKPEKADNYIPTDERIPLRNGKPLDYIPLYVYGVDGATLCADEPPLLDLAYLNISHYQTTADLEHGAHFTALPTAVITGYQKEDGETFKIGSQSAWVFGDPAAKASFLEFTGGGLSSLESRLEKKEAQMAVQGARMLAPEKKAAETEGTEVIRRAGELSFLASIAIVVSRLITDVVNEILIWGGFAPEYDYQINRDFTPARMAPQELSALVQAVQGGQISQQTFFDALQSGEIIPDGMTYEEELDRLESTPVIITQTAAQ